MLTHAFKEWAVICHALTEGKQSLILRKGGIAEAGREFTVEHTRFWLFPTYTHQQRAGIQPEALPWLDQVEAERPPPERVRLSHFAEVSGIYHIHDLAGALMLGGLHYWSEETVRARFLYRRPGLFVLAVRIYRAAQVTEILNLPEYEGCRTWVELEEGIITEGATTVLSDETFRELLRTLDFLLNPTAYA